MKAKEIQEFLISHGVGNEENPPCVKNLIIKKGTTSIAVRVVRRRRRHQASFHERDWGSVKGAYDKAIEFRSLRGGEEPGRAGRPKKGGDYCYYRDCESIAMLNNRTTSDFQLSTCPKCISRMKERI